MGKRRSILDSTHTAGFILFGLLSSLAWAGPAELAHPHDEPAGVRSLPGDVLPPFHMLDAQGRLTPIPPEFEGKRAPPATAPESTARGPSLAVALMAARAAIGYSGGDDEGCALAGLKAIQKLL